MAAASVMRMRTGSYAICMVYSHRLTRLQAFFDVKFCR